MGQARLSRWSATPTFPGATARFLHLEDGAGPDRLTVRFGAFSVNGVGVALRSKGPGGVYPESKFLRGNSGIYPESKFLREKFSTGASPARTLCPTRGYPHPVEPTPQAPNDSGDLCPSRTVSYTDVLRCPTSISYTPRTKGSRGLSPGPHLAPCKRRAKGHGVTESKCHGARARCLRPAPEGARGQ